MLVRDHLDAARESLGFFGLGGGFVTAVMIAMLLGVIAAHHTHVAEQLLVSDYIFSAMGFR